jgi:hypothetical protein
VELDISVATHQDYDLDSNSSWGAYVATYHKWTIERDCFKYSKQSLSAIVEKVRNRLIRVTNRWGEPRIDSRLTRVDRWPARQFGDMACPEEDLNHPVATATSLSSKG